MRPSPPGVGAPGRIAFVPLSLILLSAPLPAQEEAPSSNAAAAPAAESPSTSTQTAPAPAPQGRLEISDDPTYIKTSLRGVVERVEFVGEVSLERLRIRYVQALGKRDAILADIPFGRVDPGAGFSSSYGSGDLSLQYLHLFPSKSRTLLQAGGAIFVLKTASDPELSGHTALYGVVYAAAWAVSRRVQPFVVFQYIHSAREDTGVPTESLAQLRPVVAFGLSKGWFATGELRLQEDLEPEQRFGATLQASLGRQVGHWRTLGGYERALSETSEEVIYRSRIFLEFGYTF
ncbi:MAG: hypothetical protein L0191_17200 [Acidobacteria bacterium]|nr:hypothetical protein [Acidobacteriota bacterium]